MVLLTALYCLLSRSKKSRRNSSNSDDDDDGGPKVLFMRSKSFADRFNNKTNDKEDAYDNDEENHRKSNSPNHNYRDYDDRRRRGRDADESNYSVGGYPRNNGLSCNGGCNGNPRDNRADGWGLQGIFCAAAPPPTPAGDNSVKYRVAM